MAKKLIAGFALLTVTAWAGLFPLPMFAMHAMHRHPAHAPLPAGHHHARHNAHPCCPGLARQAPVATPVELAAATSESCADQHRCCFRSAPQTVPGPTSDRQSPSPDLQVIQVLTATPIPQFQSAVASRLDGDRSPPAIFGMILRI